MVEVIYDGNLGNNLFQYCFGRILAERLGYRLVAAPIPGFPGTTEEVAGEELAHAPVRVLRGQRPDLAFLDLPRERQRLLLTGYFQRYEYYGDHAARIRGWLAQPQSGADDVGPRDMVIGMRRGRDYIPRHGLPRSYYEEALAALGHERVFICTDRPRDPMVKDLARKYRATIRPTGAIDNLRFIMGFDNIVISNSTFLWWAAFLSRANRIVFPRPANGFWSAADPLSRNIALEVDEPRYTYLKCEPYRSEYPAERFENWIARGSRLLRSAARAAMPASLRREPPAGQFVFSEPDE